MKSLQITGPGQFEIVEADPPACAADEVLIEVKACTICNQHDSAVLSGRPHGGPMTYPLEPGFPGHEAAGVVVEAGADVTDLAVGDRVATTGIGGPPLYSERVTRRNGTAVKVPASVEFVHAAPLELFGCVHRAFTLTDPVEGRRVGVVGLGPAGQAATAIARAYGASEVVAFDLSPRRRDKALEMGATAAVDAAPFAGAFEALAAVLAGEAPADRSALEAVRANQCEVVFECSGSARAMEVSFLLAGKELTVFGYVPEPVRTMPAAWFAKELVIRNSKILQISDLQAVADLLAAGRIDTRPIVTDVMGFADYAAAVDKVRAGDAIKIALIWS